MEKHLFKNVINSEQLLPTDLNYILKGNPLNETLVLIHGLTSSLLTFLPIISELEKEYQILAYDQRGHGKSKEVDLDYSLESMALDLKNLLIHLKIKTPVHVLGHSAGGRTAMKFVIDYPDLVKSLIIEDMEFIPRPSESFEKTVQKALELKKIKLEFQSKDEFFKELEVYANKNELNGYLERKCEIKENGTINLMFKPAVATLYGYFHRNFDFKFLLKKLNIPTFVIGAEKNYTCITEKGLKQIKKYEGNFLSYLKISDALHNVHGSKTQEFLKALISFLKKI